MRKNRCSDSGWWVILLTATLAVTASAETSVGIFNARLQQVTTSSTLKWKTLTENPVIGADSQDGPIYLCKARQEADWLLGQWQPAESKCKISAGKIYDNFEVLENIHNASLLQWQSWSKFLSKPTGGVTLDSTSYIFVGRTKVEENYKIGRIMYESTIGHLMTYDEENNEFVNDAGEILVEVEPLGYKLENVVLNIETQHVRQDDPIIFEERVLSNEDDVAATVTTEIEYKFNYSLYWGHSHGIAIGLNTTIEMADGNVLPQIEWANPFVEERKELFKLEQYLEPGTACNVTFQGNHTNRDVKYVAKLLTLYKNESPRSRQIEGERLETTMEVEAVYGEIYFIANNSLVPTTTTTTTTTTSTTTTTTPIPPPPPAPEENEVPSSMMKDDQLGPGDTNDMMGDSSESIGKSSAKEDNISRAAVGSLGSKPNHSSSNVATCLALITPILAFLI